MTIVRFTLYSGPLSMFGAKAQIATMQDDTPRLLAWRDRMSQRAAVRAVVAPMAQWLVDAGRPLPPFMRAILEGR